jgi:hypothetical protein
LLPHLRTGAPDAREIWQRDIHDVVTGPRVGGTVIHRDIADMCRADEWLLVEAWDES